MVLPTLHIIIDGDSSKVYHQGDKVTGRVICAVEEQEYVESLKVTLTGTCVTKTTRSFYVAGNDSDSGRSKHEYEERICLFSHDQELVPQSTLLPQKYSWLFEFAFPELTEPRYKRMAHGANYLRHPHPLPPSFQFKTSAPGGMAQISYFVKAKLTLGGSKGSRRARQVLQYHPKSPEDTSHKAKLFSASLYGQTWKPKTTNEEPKSTVNKVFSKISRRSSTKTSPAPRIVPTISYPERIAPGQHIPLQVNLANTRDPHNQTQSGCTLDSLKVTISTYSTSMCGHSVTQPEDIVLKHATCISRTNMNKSIPFGTPHALTRNFRLINDAECVPTFKTYTLTRRYTLSISIGIKYADQSYTIRSTTPLEIIPPSSRQPTPLPVEEREEIDPLPLYMPRELEMEAAPDYELVCALSRTSSASTSTSSSALSEPGSLSFASENETLSMTPLTSREETGQPNL